ncbi:MAG: hypothetical protein ACKPB7_31235 [Sphaerospermopsis kisseleviana]
MVISDLSYLETVLSITIEAANTAQDLDPPPMLQGNLSTVNQKAIALSSSINSVAIAFNIANVFQSNTDFSQQLRGFRKLSRLGLR